MRIVEFTVERMVGESVQAQPASRTAAPVSSAWMPPSFRSPTASLHFSREISSCRQGGGAYKLASFGSGAIPPGQTGSAPDINRNPYNFVRFAGGEALDRPGAGA